MEIEILTHREHQRWIFELAKYRFDPSKDCDKILHLNIASNSFFEPFHVASLACFIEEFFNNGFEINFSCENSEVCDYLSDINFFAMWNDRENRANNILSSNDNLTSLGLWNINKDMIDQYTDNAQSYFEKILTQNLDLSPLYISLAETINNVCDHSLSEKKCYTISQYYPKLNKIRTSICDFGIGIVQSIVNYKGETIDALDAIKLAFQPRFTVKSRPNNAGLGLSNLKDAVINTGGIVKVFSNKSYCVIQQDGDLNVNLLLEDFNGTLIEIEFDVLKFETNDTDYTNFNYF